VENDNQNNFKNSRPVVTSVTTVSSASSSSSPTTTVTTTNVTTSTTTTVVVPPILQPDNSHLPTFNNIQQYLDRPLLFPEFIQALVRMTAVKYPHRTLVPTPPLPPPPSAEELKKKREKAELEEQERERKRKEEEEKERIRLEQEKNVKKKAGTPQSNLKSDAKSKAKEKDAVGATSTTPSTTNLLTANTNPSTVETDTLSSSKLQLEQILTLPLGPYVPLFRRVILFMDGLLDACFGDGEWRLGRRKKRETEEIGDIEIDEWDVSDRFFVLCNKRNEYFKKRMEQEKEKRKNKEQKILEGKETEEDYDTNWLNSHLWEETEKEEKEIMVETDLAQSLSTPVMDEEEEEDKFDGDDYYDEEDETFEDEIYYDDVL
jgi:hypothetical protein